MIVGSVHHVSVGVADLERSKAFYGGRLGLEEIERPDFGVPGAWYRAGPVEVHLIEVPEGVEPTRAAPKLSPVVNHVAFEIDDYPAVVAELEAEGVEFVPTSSAVGQVWIRDPDGNVIELIRPGGRLGR